MPVSTQKREISRLVRQSWADKKGGVDMLAQEVAALLEVFVGTEVLSANYAKLNVGVPDQSFTARQNFSKGVEVAYALNNNAVEIVHAGSAGYALDVTGRPARMLHGLEVWKSGAGFAFTVNDKPGVFYYGLIATQQTAANFAIDVDYKIAGDAMRILHTGSSGYALYLQVPAGRVALYVQGDIVCTGNYL